MNGFGTQYHIELFGASHAAAVGVTVYGLPAGFAPDMDALRAFLARRAPGNGEFSTARKEPDEPEFTEGLDSGVCTGAPVTAIIHNKDIRPGDYTALSTVPRPGHADYAAWVKYGEIPSGGGQFSGRMTAPLCVAGGLALQLLEKEGITVTARIVSIGGLTDPDAIHRALSEAKAAGDSLGGIIECTCTGIPAGLGGALFEGIESKISPAVLAIPAVRGIEFGAGFAAASMKGSEHNDPFYMDSDTVHTTTNHHGGILGGITTGMPLVFRVAFKPTPSIGMEQKSVDLSTMTDTTLTVTGRHDVCIVPRAVPCVEAAAACALYDTLICERELPTALADIRAQIDNIDRRLLPLLEQRIALALAAGRAKREKDLPLYDPAREAEKLARFREKAAPETADTVTTMLADIMRLCREQEEDTLEG